MERGGRSVLFSVAILFATLGAIASPGQALAAESRSWLVSGTLAGSYSSDVTWTNCLETGASGTAHESFRLSAKITPAQPAILGAGITPVVNMAPGGHWSAGGSVPPRQEGPEDSIFCAAQRSFQCGGPILRRGPAMATMFLERRGRSMLAGGFVRGPFFTEYLGENPCSLPAGAGPGPLFGLQGTDLEPYALFESDLPLARLSLPRARFTRRKPFTVKHAAKPIGGCSHEIYTSCKQTGGITLTLHFRPAG